MRGDRGGTVTPGCGRAGRYRRGFSLIEVLVAFTILSLMLGVVFEIHGRLARALAVSDGYGRAAVIAESLLARAGTDPALPPGEHRGREPGGYRWSVRIRPDTALEAGDTSAAAIGVVPMTVVVEVVWGDAGRERRFEARSLRLLPSG